MMDEQTMLDAVPAGLWIGGRWRDAAGGDTFAVTDPSTGNVIKTVADARVTDGIAALDAAAGAQESWAQTPPRERSDILRRAYDALIARREEFALLMTLEMGKPLPESQAEVNYGAEFLRWFSEEAVRITGRYGPNPEGTGRMLISYAPVGPTFAITPWNFPLTMATRKIAPAIAAGCTIVVKPAAQTPLTTLAFAKLLHEADLPAGVLGVITTTHAAEVSAAIIADPRLRKLTFTGSTSVGRELMRAAAAGILRTSMELGGNAPFLVFDDADLDAAVHGALQAKFRNIGQACTAANRFIVHRSIADDFAARITARVSAMTVGRGTETGVDIGPLIDERAAQSARELVEDAVARGARVRSAARELPATGSYFAPTVLTGVPAGSRMLREEIFGPVLGITTFSTEDEAVRLANDTEYGLVAYAYTTDLARGHRLIDRLETGMLGLNVGVVSNAAAPFGGVKQSGVGREGGTEGIREYLSTRYTLLPN